MYCQLFPQINVTFCFPMFIFPFGTFIPLKQTKHLDLLFLVRTRFKLSHLFHSVPVCQVNALDLKHNKVLTYDHQNYFHCKLFFNYPVTQVEEAHSIHSANRAGVSSQTSFRCRSTCGPSGSSGRRSSSHTCRT